MWNVSPPNVILRLFEGTESTLTKLLTNIEEPNDVMFVGHGMSVENVDKVFKHSLSMIGSDGFVCAPEGLMASVTPHPRSYGTFVRVIDEYVRHRKVVELPVAIQKMTSLAAKRLGILDRGIIKEHMKADIVIMDFDKVVDRSTFQNPHNYPEGIEYVMVNGVLVIEKANHTGAKPGKFLRRI
jgi:N-acyl-D-amino-acid deacylase